MIQENIDVASSPDVRLDRPARSGTPPAKSLTEAFPAWTAEPYVHWSAHLSLYSAKTRAYMIKKGLHFVEKTTGSDPARWREVMSGMGYSSLPVLELFDGTFISDSTAIIRYLEAKHPEPAMQPADPVMRALAWLIFNYGTEGLFLSAQHFRWSFDDSASFAVLDAGRAMHNSPLFFFMAEVSAT